MNDISRNLTALSEMRKIALTEMAQWSKKYGAIRVPIRTKHNGLAVQILGENSILRGKWITFVDFLLTYMIEKLTSAWGNSEISKPEENRHQIIKLYQELCKWQIANGAVEGIVQETYPSGFAQEYLSIAWDLFLVEDNFVLPENLIVRMKDRKNYQGARYELHIISCLLRSGYKLKYENEADGKTRHVELHAIDKRTAEVMAVEAKSRHRNGIIDFYSKSQLDSASLGIRRLIADAMTKPTTAPYYLFIDVNLGVIPLNEFYMKYRDEICSIIDSLENKYDGESGSPISGYFITNNPTHYIGENPVPPDSGFNIYIEGKNPRNNRCSREFIFNVLAGLKMQSSIPTFLIYE
jgi:hypothetical protein